MSFDSFVINEDEHAISTDSLEVMAHTGDVAPSLLCVSSSPTAAILWNKNGGLPTGVAISNGYAITGHAIKLDWKKKIHFTDSGAYTCSITLTNGTVILLGIQLNVLRK